MISVVTDGGAGAVFEKDCRMISTRCYRNYILERFYVALTVGVESRGYDVAALFYRYGVKSSRRKCEASFRIHKLRHGLFFVIYRDLIYRSCGEKCFRGFFFQWSERI